MQKHIHCLYSCIWTKLPCYHSFFLPSAQEISVVPEGDLQIFLTSLLFLYTFWDVLEVQSWIIVVSKSDINFRSSPVSPHAKAKWWQMQCILNIPLHSSSSLNLTLSHYLSQSLLYYLFPVTPLSFPVITLAPSEQNSINSSKFKPKLFSTTFLRHKKIYKASADLVSDSPKISHELRNLHTVIPSSIS